MFADVTNSNFLIRSVFLYWFCLFFLGAAYLLRWSFLMHQIQMWSLSTKMTNQQ